MINKYNFPYQKFLTSGICFAFLILSSCVKSQEQETDKNISATMSQQAKSIDAIYSAFALGHVLKHKQILGKFAYKKSNEDAGKYLTKFITRETLPSIDYLSYSDSRKDAILFGKRTFNLKNKIDPFSIALYWIYCHEKKYLCLIGKGQSASGSGVQVSYFTLFELDKSGNATTCYEFVSRFGNINSLISYDTGIAYLKIVNGKKTDQFILTANDIRTNKQLENKPLLLRYELNDKFTLL